MKRKLVSLLAVVLVALLSFSGAAQAQPLIQLSFPGTNIQLTEKQQDLLKQLEADVLPQIENILTPQQRQQFTSNVADGMSFRKAFKSLTLTPEQKTELAALFKTLPKKDIFASMTPAQKKEIFMKRKEMFTPTSEEITEKIRVGMKKGEGFIPEGITDKIKAGMQDKGSFMSNLEEIGAKITERMATLKKGE
ncbi:hypothetical protein IFO70_04700 [Phormidium tenue FACHB-886]|nr:hypothetical protein [Phormidium tenue FACHB-886]